MSPPHWRDLNEDMRVIAVSLPGNDIGDDIVISP